ncbi:MAG: hypothetical protein WCQ72_01595 [Eubacteriales bacterium]
MKRHLSLLLIAALLISFSASCGQGAANAPAGTSSTPAEDTTAVTTAETDMQSQRANTPDSLPALDFDGLEIRLYVDDSNHDYTGLNKYFQGPEELTGDVVYDTVIERNRKVEERLNVKFQYHEVSYTYDAVTSPVRKMILAGEDAYDIMVEQQWGCAKVVAEGLFLNAFDGKYFDFSQPWWWNEHMNNAAIGSDKRFMLAGDYFLDIFRSSYIIYFNKMLYENSFGTTDDLYNLVFDGGWTMEKFGKYSSDIYTDLNGDAVKNEGDIFGFTTSTSAIVDHFVYGTDVKFTERDDNGLPVLVMDNDRAYQLADMLYKLSYENDGVKLYTDDGVLRKEQEPLFMSDQLLFLPYSIGAADILRDMVNDFGMLPFPKLDDLQENYKVIGHDTSLTGFIPATCTHLDEVSAVLEALCAESYRTVMPAFYETALKVKYARDDKSSQMIDLIHDSVSSEFIYIYSPVLNDIGTFYRSLVSGKTADFASAYKKKEAGTQKKLDSLIEAYQSL